MKEVNHIPVSISAQHRHRSIRFQIKQQNFNAWSSRAVWMRLIFVQVAHPFPPHSPKSSSESSRYETFLHCKKGQNQVSDMLRHTKNQQLPCTSVAMQSLEFRDTTHVTQSIRADSYPSARICESQVANDLSIRTSAFLASSRGRGKLITMHAEYAAHALAQHCCRVECAHNGTHSARSPALRPPGRPLQ